MTAAQAIRRAAAAQLAATSDTARLDAEVLMAHALGVSRSELLLRHMDQPAPAEFSALVERRANHEPVAYIVGTQEFRSLPIRVTPDVLIPRGDSEVLIEAALTAFPPNQQYKEARVLDCGVGSGALLLSFLAEQPQWSGIGVDRSQQATEVAQANAGLLNLGDRAEMLTRDWTTKGWTNGLGVFEVILANPPYVETEAELAPSVRAHEPAWALFAGPEGLDDYRVLVPQLPALLTPGGVALVEIGATQAEAVTAIAAAVGFAVTLHRDLAQRPRVLQLQFPLGKPPASA